MSTPALNDNGELKVDHKVHNLFISAFLIYTKSRNIQVVAVASTANVPGQTGTVDILHTMPCVVYLLSCLEHLYYIWLDEC